MMDARHAAAVLLLGVLAGGRAHAQAPATRPADCVAPAFQTVLQPVPTTTVTDARAVWMSRRLLRWPQQSASGTYRLYHSASGRIVHRVGRVVLGADAVLTLDVVAAPVPVALAERYRHVGDGAVLAVRKQDLPMLPSLHRGQLLLVQEDSKGVVRAATALQVAAAFDDLYPGAAAIEDLGVRVTAQQTGFSLWAPSAQQVSLCLFERADATTAALHSMQRDDATGVWRGMLPGDRSGGYYVYLVDVFVRGIGIVRNRVTDPYAISLTTDSRRAYIAALDAPALKPAGWDEDTTPARVAAAADLTIYELHVRDFSIDDASVSAPHRGKYLAFTDDDSNGMRHLRALSAAGITDVHLLPVFDLATVPERGCVTPVVEGTSAGETQQAAVIAVQDRDCFNWGYDPFHYTAPEGSYASDAGDGAVRVREFRRMVQGLHRAGLRVGMDVVYNHTSASGQHANAVLDRIVPGYYHRLDASGRVERSTCCDNTATEHAMMARLMIDSVATWAREYRIDSFRFDLMGHQPRATMERLQLAVDAARGRHVDLLGEGWNFGEVADGARFVQASQLSLNDSGIATFSDRARDALRGGSAGDNGVDQVLNQGWLNGLHYAPNAQTRGRHGVQDLMRAADLVRVGLAGSLRDYELLTHRGPRLPLSRIDYAGQPAGYASQPGEVVNYVENHDNQTLFDLNAFKLPQDTSREDRARVQLLGVAITAFSQGIAYFHAGIDVLRSKSMDRNSYDSGDAFNRLDWSYRDNHFGEGLPPQRDNQASWNWMRLRLADAAIKPGPAEIEWMRDAFRDLLRIRASSTLFRLRRTEDVQQRLRFPNSGPTQVPTVMVGHLDGRGLAGAGFAEVLYLVNADKRAQTLILDSERGKGYRLHPVHRAVGAADRRAATESAFDATSGSFTVPARTAVVYVVE